MAKMPPRVTGCKLVQTYEDGSTVVVDDFGEFRTDYIIDEDYEFNGVDKRRKVKTVTFKGAWEEWK